MSDSVPSPEPAVDVDASEPPAPIRRTSPVTRRIVAAIAILLVLALVVVTVFAVVSLRRPLPDVNGEVNLPGLSESVTVTRDAQGVPDITAQTDLDLFRAQGYVHAQDRFFEMDYRRHVTSGRMAELVGNVPSAIQADTVTRTFGWRAVAEQEWDLLADDTKTYLQAYADGVNAYLDERDPGELAVEYTVLGQSVTVEDPERWDPIDSVAWLKAMAWDLRGNYDDELGRALAYTTLGTSDNVENNVSVVEELFPAYPEETNQPILTADEISGTPAATVSAEGLGDDLGTEGLDAAIASAEAALDAVPVLVGRGDASGSNSWVVSGEHTESGMPLLANDPHLALGAPSIWSQIGLHCAEQTPDCTFDVSGFSFAGFPGVIIGHNGDLAWGLTNMGADVTDFFVERVRSDTYLRDGEWEPIDVRKETIVVNGGDDVVIEVRSTVHGPLMSDALPELDAATSTPHDDLRLGSYSVALQWTALTPGNTADAIFAFDRAQDADDIRDAAALFEVPAQNIVFATTDGHIGYQAPGSIPVRNDVDGAVPSDGSWPRPGWDSAYDWQGYVDSDDMPFVLDPEDGIIVAANQAVLPAGVGPFLTNDWAYGYRSERIRTLLQNEIDAGRQIDTATMSEIQLDDWSAFGATLVPVLLEQELDDDFVDDGQELLADWDFHTGTDSAAAAYFNAVWSDVLELAFWDDVPPSMRPSGGSQWLQVVIGLLDDPTNPLWDNRTTLGVVETRDEVLSQSLENARLELTSELSKRTDDWEWGKVHQLRLQHPVLGGEDIPGVISGVFNPGAVELPGGTSIVNAIGWDASAGSFDVTTGPSMRMVVDLDDLDRSTWVTVTGTSGHPASSHYDDQLDAWATGETFAWPFSAEARDESAEDTLVLRP
ncbi:penicillin acylase family protein [Paraoerskovia marina]|uniref:penicillin acylase family protein n=1 Tax=Paraoerskovia marina TaxID=545619 RepID=UPI000A7BB4E4